jgi:hypothetical protein
LLLQGFTQLFEQARVLDGDDGLCGEIGNLPPASLEPMSLFILPMRGWNRAMSSAIRAWSSLSI